MSRLGQIGKVLLTSNNSPLLFNNLLLKEIYLLWWMMEDKNDRTILVMTSGLVYNNGICMLYSQHGL